MESLESINDLKENYLKYFKSLNYLKYYRKYYLRKFRVIFTYLEDHIMGMTDCKGNIWISKKFLDRKNEILKHEVCHNLNPSAPEYLVRILSKYIDLSQFYFEYF